MPQTTMSEKTIVPKSITVLRRVIYVTSSLLFFLWGFFFVEHLAVFFSPEIPNLPVMVWIIQGLHFILLIGYLMVFKWPRVAAILILASALVFFPLTAGKNATLYTLISLVPVYLIGFLWWRDRKLKSASLQK